MPTSVCQTISSLTGVEKSPSAGCSVQLDKRIRFAETLALGHAWTYRNGLTAKKDASKGAIVQKGNRWTITATVYLFLSVDAPSRIPSSQQISK